MAYVKGKLKNATGDVLLPLTTSDKVVNNTTDNITVATSLGLKADKITSAVNGNLIKQDATGNLVDAGVVISIDGTFADNSDAKLPTEKAIKTYVASQVLATPTIQGTFDASVDTFPATRTDLSAIQAGDYWIISVAGTLGGEVVNAGDFIYALVSTPGQTSTNWGIVEKNLGYTPENITNKITSWGTPTDVQYASAKLAKDSLDGKVDKVAGYSLIANTDITKLSGIEANAQVNILDGVQINGSDLTITSKKVNIGVAGANLGVVKTSAISGNIGIDGNGVMSVNNLGTPALLNTTSKEVVGAINEVLSASLSFEADV